MTKFTFHLPGTGDVISDTSLVKYLITVYHFKMATGAVNESKLYSEYHIITKKALQNLALFERAVRNEHKLTYKRKQADRTI